MTRVARLPLLITTLVVSATFAVIPAEAQPASNPGCAVPLFAGQVRAQDALKNHPQAFAAAATVNKKTLSSFTALAQDRTFWLDACGHGLYIEPELTQTQQDVAEIGANTGLALAPQTEAAATTAATALRPLSDTFLLESRPTSTKTIYLDFGGATVTGTAWNNTYGDPLTFTPYSITSPVDTTFTSAELTEIQKVWQVVAEDYAPFDVNVTTKDPGFDGIERTSSSDTVYGTRVLITEGGAIYTSCRCGGIAYIGVFSFSSPSHMYYQPAFVFTSGVGTSAKTIGEAASHEAGHNFSLNHDGISGGSSYYLGDPPWAPIMGAGYYQPVSQWSAGEYSGANNTQNDLATIANHVPVRVDDHGNTTDTATALVTGTPINGVITSRTDVDAFTFTASGATTVSVTVADYADLDAQLRIVDSTGTTVTTVDPAVAKVSSSVASGLSASWTTTLPSTPATYTAFVDGVGSGNPLTLGKYSDYASLGNYQISLSTVAAATPLSATSSNPTDATVGTAYSASPVSVTGGTTPYSYAASGLPGGLSISSSTGTITGNPTTEGTYNVTVTVTDAATATSDTSFQIVVVAAPNPVVISTSNPATAVVNSSYNASPVSATGGTTPYTFTASGLPSGLTMSTSGTVSGIPTRSGTYLVTTTVTDAGSQTSTGTFTIVVNPALAFATSTNLPSATLNRAYSTTISVNGGIGPYSWSRTGSIPPGMTLNLGTTRTQTLSGVPTAKGKYTFTLTVTDSLIVSVSRTFSITVK